MLPSDEFVSVLVGVGRSGAKAKAKAAPPAGGDSDA